ncbi:MMPL family transporter [Methylobacter sp. YRD-M1]|uniref:MMPL family transporter n=1 Tax=Methylobacter sp. YRD-M1 TaxID=2911520 RepID=UPI00227C69FD|nr:MMPL family transporter [Methylobacter sp. YRD-M1]WAK03511.1 MMPL family transporter [Methylobacter sp. YRD-M1]
MKKVTEVYGQFITHLDSRLLRYPKTLILLVLLLCGFSLYYTAKHMGVDADTTDILSKDLQFQKDRERFIKTFPQDDQAILVVVDAKTPEQATQALDYLGAQFSREKQQIQSVYIPGAGDFFDRHGLLYPDLKEVQDLAGKMTEAQPFIGALSKDNSLKGLLLILGQALTEEAHELPADLNPMLDKIRLAVRAAIEDKTYQLSWQQMMMGEDNDLLSTRRFILLKPHLEFNELMPAEKPLATVRAITDKAEQAFPGVNVRLTGEVVLEHDELATVTYSAEMASAFSFLLVFLSLLVGFRSVKLTLATLSVLTMGLMLTFGFATLAFGNLNLISISFAALYIGIGDDYAVQVCMRYRELLQQKMSRWQALTEAVRRVAPPITLCAITGATGFFSFVPTKYTGVSELGAIAGAGIFISLLITLTVLPAVLKLFPLNSGPAKKSDHLFPDWVYRFPIEHAKLVRWTTLALIVVGLGLLTQARFDINPLNLRDPESESVVTFRELLKTKDTSPMTLTVMAKSKDETLATAEKLKQLESVENAITIFDYIPADQEAKLAIIEDLSMVMGLQLTTFPAPFQDSVESNMAVLEKFKLAIEQYLQKKPDGELAATLRLLLQEVESLIAVLKSESEPEKKATLDKLQRSLLGTLPQTMNTLLKGLNPDPVTVDTLPRDLAERWLSTDGVYRIMVTPSKDLNDEKNLKEFIKEVRQVAPNATDLPVIYLESGAAIVRAFQQALASAVAAIILVLLFTQRNAKDALLILLPLITTAILTGVSTVLMDNPFNFANIIVIPILFGLGVDAGINIMSRLRSPEHEDSVLRTGTARGVVFSELTTMCSLVSMAFTPHLGLASMGQLLSIGLLLNILCTLIVLPAFAYKAPS